MSTLLPTEIIDQSLLLSCERIYESRAVVHLPRPTGPLTLSPKKRFCYNRTVEQNFLVKAIHNEIAAKDAYRSIADKIEASGGKKVMLAMSAEEENHREILDKRHRILTGEECKHDPELATGPSFAFIDKSVFTHTDALEALSLCLGAEIDAIEFYSDEMSRATESDDIRMLKSLVNFEKKHKKKLERELNRLKKANHWKL